MSVLVTGGTGFLGSRLVDRLQGSGREVVVVSRQPQPKLAARGVRVVVGPLHQSAVCAEACRGVSTVFHTAARVGVWGRAADFHRDNVLATAALLAAAREAGVTRFIFTSTPSVVYNGSDLRGVDESLPLTTDCPSPYPLTKALAERAVLDAHASDFRTIALRPHLIWGIGDPHLIPRVLARARAGRLRIIGSGSNRVDLVHIDNAVRAHLCAEEALGSSPPSREAGSLQAGGRPYFITNEEPVSLWGWINDLLVALGREPVRKRMTLATARRLGGVCEALWRTLPLPGEPPLTRFVADELAKDHWFNPAAARRDLGYRPQVTMAKGMADLVVWYRDHEY